MAKMQRYMYICIYQCNAHQKTAQAVDVFHKLFVMWLREYMYSPIPETGRARHFHLSADKATIGNMARQNVNILYIEAMCLSNINSVCGRDI